MTEIIATQRKTPTIITPTDDLYDWGTVNKLLDKRTVFNFFQLAVSPWLTVLAPVGVECTETNWDGRGLYQYKCYKGRTYCLKMRKDWYGPVTVFDKRWSYILNMYWRN